MNDGEIKFTLRSLIISTIFIVGSLNLYGQSPTETKNSKNSVSIDCATFKFIGMFSFNYDRTIIYSTHYKMLANAGIGGWYFTTISKWYYGPSIPLSLNNLLGSGNNYFETDLGIRYTSFSNKSDKGKPAFFPIFNIGYRYQRPDGKGLIFRPFIGLSGIGIGIGKAF